MTTSPSTNAPEPGGLDVPIPTAPRNDPQSWNSFASPGLSDHAIAGWGSPESQVARFRAALDIPLADGDRILDFGCGAGALADLCPVGNPYSGLDWSSAMVEVARARRPDRSFTVGSAEGIGNAVAEWVIASGPFNIASGWTKEETRGSLELLWAASTKGISVTLLRVPVADRLHYSAAELTGWVAHLDWAHLEFDTSYLPHDLCMRLRR